MIKSLICRNVNYLQKDINMIKKQTIIKDFKEIYLIAILMYFLLFLIFAFVFFSHQKSCELKWRESGYIYKWEIRGGCKIQDENDKWIPARNFMIVSKG